MPGPIIVWTAEQRELIDRAVKILDGEMPPDVTDLRPWMTRAGEIVRELL